MCWDNNGPIRFKQNASWVVTSALLLMYVQQNKVRYYTAQSNKPQGQAWKNTLFAVADPWFLLRVGRSAIFLLFYLFFFLQTVKITLILQYST